MTRRLTAILLCALPALATAQPAKDAERIRQAVESRLLEMHKDAGFPGMTASYILKNGEQTTIAIGLSDTDSKRKMEPNDRMLAGSIGKTYFAAVTLQMVWEERLQLDEPISKWLGQEPWFGRLPNANTLTLRHLMNHTSGIPEHVLRPGLLDALRKNRDKEWKPAELLAFILDEKPLFAPGSSFSYADTNYIVVGMVVESVLGGSFYDEVRKRILEPLKLSDTVPSTSRRLLGLVQGYSMPGSPFGLEGPLIKGGMFAFNPQMEWTGGGFLTTSADLARWARALYAGTVLPSAMLLEMAKSVKANTGPGDEYGLGVQIRHTPHGITYGHGGWFPGYLSEVEHFPEHGLTIAVQFNTDHGRKLKRSTHGYVVEIAKMILTQEQESRLQSTDSQSSSLR